ncbi:MAG: exo-alpha-sialidase [Pirellula sp.]|nr:exo-alpha-sialidase [Pirellula sp.]
MIRHFTLTVVFTIVAWGASFSCAAEPELVSVRKIWDAGKHNAFTDLIRWHDRFWCTFREADDHVGGNGALRVLTSTDGDVWESAALVTEQGIDLRDPKLSVTPDDRLMIVAGGSTYDGKTLLGRRPRVAFSVDGRTWTAPVKVLGEGEWLWRVTWHEGVCYGAAYDASKRSTPAAKEAAKLTTPAEPGPAEWKLKLYKSADGVKYDLITHLDVPGHPNETTLRFLPDGRMLAMVRREGGSKLGWLGTSLAPYTKWTWHETDMRIGGPNFIVLPSGKLWAVTRLYGDKRSTVVARMDEKSLRPVLEFPSAGDTSYAGIVDHDGLLWVSYYSTHEEKTSIYLAKVRLPKE